ncbi:MAG: response regulator [Candidatus Methanoperedens sp.]|nr:response regulator [Candidatus Methanoperedens sp.]
MKEKRVKKILVVDDNKNDRMLLRELLSTNNYDVSEACNGIDALRYVRTSKPEIIISDIMMPEMDGFTLLRELKKNSFSMDIPFVFYTANYVSEKDSELASKLGASRFILKPAELNDLLEEIGSVISECESGPIKGVKPLISNEEEYLKQYSERIVRKLEEKIVQLEQEINERRWAFEELAKAQNELEKIMECIPDIIYAINLDGNLIRWNNRLTEVTGLLGNQIMGRPVLNFIVENDRAKMAEAISVSKDQGYASVDAGLIGKDGKPIPYHWTGAALKDETGKVIGLTGVGIDFTESRKEKLQRQKNK